MSQLFDLDDRFAYWATVALPKEIDLSRPHQILIDPSMREFEGKRIVIRDTGAYFYYGRRTFYGDRYIWEEDWLTDIIPVDEEEL